MASTVRSNKARMAYVPLETFELVLAKAPTSQWRALMVLARVSALRVPSEVCGLRWEDVDWDRKRVTVRSPKTEHHEGHESRVIPLFPVVEVELLKFFAEAEDEAEEVFPAVTMESNLRRGLERIIKAAEVKQWPKLWQNLRASGATDMARSYPAHIATAICGHSIEIAQEHYWQVTDADFDDILAEDKIGGHSGGHIRGHNVATAGNSKSSDEGSEDRSDQEKQGKKEPQATRGNIEGVGEEGLEPPTSTV
ncbi:MAG: site-specific integrase [Planctomycetales bacterium]|nr:site-specific integrase [Planctomycetales bacterium]